MWHSYRFHSAISPTDSRLRLTYMRFAVCVGARVDARPNWTIDPWPTSDIDITEAGQQRSIFPRATVLPR